VKIDAAAKDSGFKRKKGKRKFKPVKGGVNSNSFKKMGGTQRGALTGSRIEKRLRDFDSEKKGQGGSYQREGANP